MEQKFNPVGWFEIPVKDMDRAITFYNAVFGYEFEKHDMGSLQMAWFPMNDEAYGAPGALVKHDQFYNCSKDGALLYFSSINNDIEVELEKAKAAGAAIIKEKESLGEYGFMGMFIDSEGNRIALHSTN